MPYKSEAQRRFFNSKKGKEVVGEKNVKEFNRESKGMKLPEKVGEDKDEEIKNKRIYTKGSADSKPMNEREIEKHLDEGLPSKSGKYDGMSYIEILEKALQMENDAAEINLMLLEKAKPQDREKFIEIANDENDHSLIYQGIISRERGRTQDRKSAYKHVMKASDSLYQEYIKQCLKSASVALDAKFAYRNGMKHYDKRQKENVIPKSMTWEEYFKKAEEVSLKPINGKSVKAFKFNGKIAKYDSSWFVVYTNIRGIIITAYPLNGGWDRFYRLMKRDHGKPIDKE